MIGYVKTTLLLLFLLCVTKPIQAENDKSTDKSTSSNDSEAIESKANVTESSSVKSLDKLESTTDSLEKTTQVSTEGGEEKRKNVVKDEVKRAEGRKGDHTLRRKRRSQISAIRRKYSKDDSEEAEEAEETEETEEIEVSEKKKVSGSRKTDEDDSDLDSEVVDSSETYRSDKDKANDTVSEGNDDDLFKFSKKFLDNSCDAIESFDSLQSSIENLLVQMEKSGITVRVDPDTVMSHLSLFKKSWKEYCKSPKKTKDALEFFNDFLYISTKSKKNHDDPSNKEPVSKSDDAKKRFIDPQLISTITKTINGLVQGKTRAEQLRGGFWSTIWGVIKRIFSTIFGSSRRSNDFLATLSTVVNALGGTIDQVNALITGPEAGKRSEGGLDISTFENSEEEPYYEPEEPEFTRRSEDKEPSIEMVLQKYCELSRGSSNIIMTLKALVKEFDVSDKPGAGRRQDGYFDKFFDSLKAIVEGSSSTTAAKRSAYEPTFVKEVIEKYCEGLKQSNSALTSISKRTVKRPVKPKVRTKSSKTDSVSGERRSRRSEYDDTIAWRQGVFEPEEGQNVINRPTEKSPPRLIRKSKIRMLKKPKNLKNRIINLYNGKENGTRTRAQRGQFSNVKIIGHKENPSTSFEVKTGVERDTGSKDSNPRLRCNVRTKGSMSDAEGRTGSSKGHTFSEVPSNDTKALLCSSETSEVYRPNKDVYIKQSVSGKSIVSYDNPDKYIRHNYSPSKENLEIGTSGFSTLNDASSKNQSISVVSTDSQNADSKSRSETKFVQDGSQRGIESSANVEGSIDAVPNKNPFITNSRQHNLGVIVENPDKNMESPLPVEQNEKLQTYSKFQRTEDFDITFRRINPERTSPHRRRPR